jgi:NNP family nitrate/nitrite transporter-like MFS transporter
MPLLFAGIVMFGAEEALGWRLAMVVPGLVLLGAAAAYWFLTTDTPDGNYDELRAAGALPASKDTSAFRSFLSAARDPRVWALFVVYAACFGVELTINNIAAIYFFDRFELDLGTAGLIAGLFGLMNIFARTLGGLFSDRLAAKGGLSARVRFLFAVLFLEGLALILFSQMTTLAVAVGAMVVFSLFVQMSEGATFGVVPFINRKALGAVAGIVGAGGNAGAVAAGFLFKSEALTYQQGLLYLGAAVVACSFFALAVRFPAAVSAEEKLRFEQAAGRPSVLPAE